MVAVIEQPKVQLGAEYGSERTLLTEPGKRVREEGEDIDLQSALRLLGVRKATRNQDSTRSEIDLPDAGVDQRKRKTRVELENVVRRSRRDLDDPAEHPAALLVHGQAHELEDVELPGLGLGQALAWHVQLGSALDGPVEPDHRPSTRTLRLDDLGRLAGHEQLCTERESFLRLARVLDDERTFEPVRLADPPDRDSHVSDSK
jgi:hypothetical protein